MKISFSGRILILGCGSVSRCLQPLILRHFDMDFSKLTIMDFEDLRHLIPDTLAAGAQYVRDRVTQDNLPELLGRILGPGDLLIDLAWNIDCNAIIDWCHHQNVLYLNTSVEVWDPYEDAGAVSPLDRTLYVRHMRLRKLRDSHAQPGPTAVVEHGANPGLVSHWTKVALIDLAAAMLGQNLPEDSEQRAELARALADERYPELARLTGTKVIHISERDTQISDKPKQVDEFVNTWSVAGLHEEGLAPAEMGWGTHEKKLPANAYVHTYGPANQICLAQMGCNTFVRSWVPEGGEIVGMVVRHGEAFTISDHLTVWEDGEFGKRPIYRPTVHYAYLPTDAAIASLHELRMRNYDLQPRQRIMNDEILSGKDELGVLLLGHGLNGWWTGSQLDIHEARRLVPGQSATTVQVAASVLGAVAWMIKNPSRGVCVPDDLPHRDVLAVAAPYLGPTPSLQTDWTPLKNRFNPFEAWNGAGRPAGEDVWQFGSFVAW
ncbi:MAG: saccharopine dehydrogenase NADP-binding domain-containing protein [Anaerolineales bacterium]|nr:saccharopine dehydrogenase NADP-binding domain-containing protein [Anaerolineales bacterium]